MCLRSVQNKVIHVSKISPEQGHTCVKDQSRTRSYVCQRSVQNKVIHESKISPEQGHTCAKISPEQGHTCV